MKVAILSMQRVNNMGSLLQSYALKRMIEGLGCVVEFMDIENINTEKALIENSVHVYADEKELYPTILKKIDKFIINRIRNRFLFKRQVSIFNEFRNNQLLINQVSDHYDICVIGSDEVFNCQDDSSWGFTSQLFGNVKNSDRIITYAASCGNSEYNDIPECVKAKISASFVNISFFSVRDANTYEFVNRLSDCKKIEVNLDPVLVYDFSNEVVDEKTPHTKYCIVYSYYNRIHDESEIQSIISFCNRRNLELIAVGAPQFWIKKYVVCSPLECISIFSNANFVITDSFHGTILSVRFSNKYAIKMRTSNNKKLSDLIDRLEIKNHIWSETNTLDRIACIEKEYSFINHLREDEEQRTIEYLKSSMAP